MYLSVRSAITNIPNQEALKNRLCFLVVMEAASLDQMVVRVGSSEFYLLGLQMPTFSLCPHLTFPLCMHVLVSSSLYKDTVLPQ